MGLRADHDIHSPYCRVLGHRQSVIHPSHVGTPHSDSYGGCPCKGSTTSKAHYAITRSASLGIIPEASADTAAAASLFDTLDKTTPSRMPTGVAVAKKPITVQNFCMLACTAAPAFGSRTQGPLGSGLLQQHQNPHKMPLPCCVKPSTTVWTTYFGSTEHSAQPHIQAVT